LGSDRGYYVCEGFVGHDFRDGVVALPAVAHDRIAGVVLGPRGDAVANARVVVASDAYALSLRTGASGAFGSPRLPKGQYGVTATLTSRSAHAGPIELDGVGLTSDVLLTLSTDRSTLAGVVRRDDDHAAGVASITLESKTRRDTIFELTSDERGRFELAVPPDEYHFRNGDRAGQRAAGCRCERFARGSRIHARRVTHHDRPT
jgi:hypothetical protein